MLLLGKSECTFLAEPTQFQRKIMKNKTDSFRAKGDDGLMYTVNILTTMISHQGRQLSGSSEYQLENGDELFDVPGVDDQWDIASTNVRIIKA